MPNPSLVRRHKGLVRHSAHQLLHLDLVRFAVARARFEWYSRRRGVQTLEEGGAVAADTVMHNLKGLRDLAVVRSLYLIRPLSVLDHLAPDADVLVVGPRTEGELLALLAHGFDRQHVRGVDLISYSPWIELGDMHALPYPDDSFDAVVAGWVLSYSDDKERAAAELLRVARPGATIAVGIEWNPLPNEAFQESIGYVPGSHERLLSTDAILELFGGAVDEVLVRQEPHPSVNAAQPIVVLFTVKR